MATDPSQKLEYSSHLRRAISDTFINFIIPNNVIHIIHRYNLSVLTERDIENVRSCEHNRGPKDANELLLERLHKYDGWFECLIKVLRDPDVKLPHVAEAMLETKKNLDQTLAKKGIENLKIKGSSKPTNDFSLSSTSQDSTGLKQSEADPVEATYPDGHTPKTSYNPMTADNMPRAQAASQSPKDGPTQKRHNVTSNKPDRDFTEQEVQVLAGFKGWDPDITETQVVQKLTPCLMYDGHFILWYWKTKKRPAISVIDKKQIKTLLVHKKPDPQDQSKVSYYINKNGTYKTNLKEILDHHFNEGVEDMGGDSNGGKITFIQPAN
ncbi:uncharacterized protein LOC131937246 [Physella acuta]|uniref:uncharacterized protein LOC131937246 n=1 Tax=Physella acuta TaxID=109671 RepID=UPI0027DB3C11|nr:uncharacterized protein LOC131937246 [Physella acuta]XP_059150500.1 uncharacterized protein LOC131937246 [Physella acuta]XP_059150501.1 uncharacterized protein LOC131937246 [Physella acuta]